MEVATSSALLLPFTASSVGVARRRLIDDLTEAGVYEATACDAGLVISELISNALRHATPLPGSVVKVAWRVAGDCVEVAVSDGGGPTLPAVSQPGSSEIGGRGLGIVERLSLRWGGYADADDEATTVWAELALTCDDEDELSGMTANGSGDRNPSGLNLLIASSLDA